MYRHQLSVEKNKPSNKLAHVALCKKYHGIDYSDICSDEMLNARLQLIVTQMEDNLEKVWGYRRHYEVIAREMRAIVYRLIQAGKLENLPGVTQDWDESWIDSIHYYTYPNINERFTSIFAQYADRLEESVGGLPKGLANYPSTLH